MLSSSGFRTASRLTTACRGRYLLFPRSGHDKSALRCYATSPQLRPADQASCTTGTEAFTNERSKTLQENFEPTARRALRFDEKFVVQQQGMDVFLAAAKKHLSTYEFFVLPYNSTVSLLMKRKDCDDDMWTGLAMRYTDGPAKGSPDICRFGNLRPAVRLAQDKPPAFIFGNIGDSAKPESCWWLRQCSDFSPEDCGASVKTYSIHARNSGISIGDLFMKLEELYEVATIMRLSSGGDSSLGLRSKIEWFVDSCAADKRRRSRRLLGQLITLVGPDEISFPIVGKREATRYQCLLAGSPTLVRAVPCPVKREKYQSSSVHITYQTAINHHNPYHLDDEFGQLLILWGGGADHNSLTKIGIFPKWFLCERGIVSGNGRVGTAVLYTRWNGDVSGTHLDGTQDHILDLKGISREEVKSFLNRHMHAE